MKGRTVFTGIADYYARSPHYSPWIVLFYKVLLRQDTTPASEIHDKMYLSF